MRALLLTICLACLHPAAFATCVEPPADGRERDAAISRITSLPEARALIKSSPVPVLFQPGQALEPHGSKCYWSIAIYENHKTHLHALHFFLVEYPKGELLAQDPMSGEFISIERWREERLRRGLIPNQSLNRPRNGMTPLGQNAMRPEGGMPLRAG